MHEPDRGAPPREKPSPSSERSQSRHSLVPVLMVVLPLLSIIVGLVALTGRAGLLMLLVVACIPGFILLHYLLWGRWLARTIRQQADRAQSESDD